MANQLDGSKRSNQIYELDSIRYLREEDAADIFGLPYSTVHKQQEQFISYLRLHLYIESRWRNI